MKLEPGDLVLVPFPFSDLSGSKSRPAIVLSSEAYNDGSKDVIVCGVTSKLTNAAHSVVFRPQDMSQGRLRVISRAKADKILSLEKTLIRKRVGRLKQSIVGQIRKEVLSVLGV